MRVSILIVVSAIVILVIALVLLAIFSSVIPDIQTITGARNQCSNIGIGTCSTSGTLPANWAIPTYNVDEGGGVVTRSCAYLMRATCGDDLTGQTCSRCGFRTP